MKRALLLLAALAAPALAHAQASGTMTFTEGTNDMVRGRYITAAECTTATDVQLAWTIALNSDVKELPAAGATYQVYASNEEVTDTTCHTSTPGGTSTIVAGPVGDPLPASTLTVTETYSTNSFPSRISLSCSTATDTFIYVCVQARNSSGSAIGVAKGSLILSITPPGPPTGVGAGADEQALRISWAEPSKGYDYRVTAISVLDPAVDLTTRDPRDATLHQATTAAHATSYRMTGLVNDVTYLVKVYARSEAGNESGPSAEDVLGTPVPVNDFWEQYVADGGREQGGCAAGAAGPLALLGVAALLAALRRRA